jgi:hypothetical protein
MDADASYMEWWAARQNVPEPCLPMQVYCAVLLAQRQEDVTMKDGES